MLLSCDMLLSSWSRNTQLSMYCLLFEDCSLNVLPSQRWSQTSERCIGNLSHVCSHVWMPFLEAWTSRPSASIARCTVVMRWNLSRYFQRGTRRGLSKVWPPDHLSTSMSLSPQIAWLLKLQAESEGNSRKSIFYRSQGWTVLVCR